MLKLISLLAKLAGIASRIAGRGGGTSLPGKIAHRLRPSITAELARQLPAGIVLVSATNGKTTTSGLISSCLKEHGFKVASNSAGANLISGITTALLNQAKTADIGVFEVDEAVLPAAVKQLKPRAVVLLNLFRDQLDRYGELEKIIYSWQQALAELLDTTILVANADDPLIVSCVMQARHKALFFGVEDTPAKKSEPPSLNDAQACRNCGHKINYEYYFLGHLGKWNCPNCDLSRPQLDASITHIEAKGQIGIELKVQLANSGQLDLNMNLLGTHNAYNALAAATAASALDIKSENIVLGLSKAGRIFGRFEEIQIGSKTIYLILAKNPVSANENIHALNLHTSGQLHLMAVLNDRIADGRDVSWIWDVDYELLLPRLQHLTLAGDRPHDLALRFIYARLTDEKIHIQPDLETALDSALEMAPENLAIFVTYTALLDMQKLLAKRKLIQPYWKEPANV